MNTTNPEANGIRPSKLPIKADKTPFTKPRREAATVNLLALFTIIETA
jgi:hypothetical protein